MQHDIRNMNLHDLCDLLADKTKEFLELLGDKNADPYELRDLKLFLDEIQAEIKSSKHHINGAKTLLSFNTHGH